LVIGPAQPLRNLQTEPKLRVRWGAEVAPEAPLADEVGGRASKELSRGGPDSAPRSWGRRDHPGPVKPAPPGRQGPECSLGSATSRDTRSAPQAGRPVNGQVSHLGWNVFPPSFFPGVPSSIPAVAHGVRRQPTPRIVRSEIHAPTCNSQYTLSKETRQVQPGTRLGPYALVGTKGGRHGRGPSSQGAPPRLRLHRRPVQLLAPALVHRLGFTGSFREAV